MRPPSEETKGRFVVATPARSVCDDNARVLAKEGRLRFLALGTRRGSAGVPPELTRLNPKIGLAAYAAAKVFPSLQAETFRAALFPWFDHWVGRQLHPSDHIISSYGYVNECFARVREQGGRTFLDGGNSHPENYWRIISEEHARWNCPLDPFPRNWYERSLAMMPLVDYVLSPSSYVTQSFLARGFKPEQILRNIYPVNLDCFRPSPEPRPKDRPLTIISTGTPSLRKGTPYLLEAFRLVRRGNSSARLLLTGPPHPSVKGVMEQFRDLPIEWSPSLPHAELAERLRSADVFVLPSLEEGLVRTAVEAMACGLQVVLTPNTGANDWVHSGINGEIVPIRDATAVAEGILKCWERMQSAPTIKVTDWHAILSFDAFARAFTSQLRAIGF